MSGVCRNVRTIGTGSAIPVVSMSTASSGLPCSIRFRMESKAPRRSPRTVQHMQPFSMTTTCSAKSIAASFKSSLSIGTAPNSFSMTANFFSRWPLSKWFNTVVFPAPRNPVKIVMGTGWPATRGFFICWTHASASSAAGHKACRASPRTTTRSPSLKCSFAWACGGAAAWRAGLIKAQTRAPKPAWAQRFSIAAANCLTVQASSHTMSAPTSPCPDAGNATDEWNPSVNRTMKRDAW
mmetsp:Transcript_54312/g.151201  ORF Transcript_54312/g.151201 Transcript_54312/m.151201 type:complete len:238 (-) Transcript_54312:87-800(-)